MDVSFNQLVAFYRHLEFGDDDEAKLVIKDEATLRLANAVLRDTQPDDVGIGVLDGDPNQMTLDEVLRVVVHQPNRRLGVLAKSIDDLVQYGQIQEPVHYYVRSLDYASGEQTVPADVQRYRAVMLLLDLLKESADYFDKINAELVFAQGRRFGVTVRFTLRDVPQDVISQVSALHASFGDALHRTQKLSILADVVSRVTTTCTPESRFAVLLSRISDITRGLIEGYRLFAASFSYERVKNAAKDAQIEFTQKIHKVFSEIQNQLLAIPVATVVVATQMRNVGGNTVQFWINTGIVLGSVVFAFLFLILAHNQRRTLDVMGEEIARRRQVIAKRYGTLDDLFNETFRELGDRLKSQRRILSAISGLVCVGALATVAVYFWLSLCQPHA